MRHLKKKKILGRKRERRKLLMRNLASSLILHEKVKTTSAKAKLLRSFIERIITKSRQGELKARREILKILPEKSTNKLLKEIGPRYKEKKGGFTRITRLKYRKGDNALLVLIEFI